MSKLCLFNEKRHRDAALAALSIIFYSILLMFLFVRGISSLKEERIINDIYYLRHAVIRLTITVFLTFIYCWKFEGYNKRQIFKYLGLRLNSKTIPDLLFGFLLSGVLIGFLYGVELTFGWINIDKFGWEIESFYSLVERSFLWLLIYVLVGIWEELAARGYLLHILEKYFSVASGVIISSIWFASIHLLLPYPTWRTALVIFTVGVFLAYSKIRTNQIWLPIGLHIGWNFFANTIFGFSLSSINNFSLLQSSGSGPEWLIGGKFGLEDGLLTLSIIPLGAIAVCLWTHNRGRSI